MHYLFFDQGEFVGSTFRFLGCRQHVQDVRGVGDENRVSLLDILQLRHVLAAVVDQVRVHKGARDKRGDDPGPVQVIFMLWKNLTSFTFRTFHNNGV